MRITSTVEESWKVNNLSLKLPALDLNTYAAISEINISEIQLFRICP
jgi:hypothetical protein